MIHFLIEKCSVRRDCVRRKCTCLRDCMCTTG